MRSKVFSLLLVLSLLGNVFLIVQIYRGPVFPLKGMKKGTQLDSLLHHTKISPEEGLKRYKTGLMKLNEEGPDAAIAYFKAQCNEAHNDWLLFGLAWATYRKEYATKITSNSQALFYCDNLLNSVQNPEVSANVKYLKGILLSDMDASKETFETNMELSIKTLMEAHSDYKALGKYENAFKTSISIVRTLVNQCKWDEATVLLDKISIDASPEKHDLFYYYWLKSWVSFNKKNISGAKHLLGLAISEAQKHKLEPEKQLCLIHLSFVTWALGDIETSEQLILEAKNSNHYIAGKESSDLYIEMIEKAILKCKEDEHIFDSTHFSDRINSTDDNTLKQMYEYIIANDCKI